MLAPHHTASHYPIIAREVAGRIPDHHRTPLTLSSVTAFSFLPVLPSTQRVVDHTRQHTRGELARAQVAAGLVHRERELVCRGERGCGIPFCRKVSGLRELRARAAVS